MTKKATKTVRVGDPIVELADAAAFDAWLAKHHASSTGVRLRLRKGARDGALRYPEAVEVALTWGWIDGVKQSYDDASWLQRFSPRGPRSIWSKINVAKVAHLVAAGRMKAPGLAAVERAKANGQWAAAYDAPSTSTTPPELAAALQKNKKAAAAYAKLDKRNTYALHHRVQTAKKAETKAKRVADFVAMLARGDKLYP